MKYLGRGILYLIFALAIVGVGKDMVDTRQAHAAQNPSLTPSTLSIPTTVLHTNCTAATGQTVYCFAGDGLWVSTNGAAFAQVQGNAPVLSVNGKTGNVVLSATTSLQ